MRRFLLAAAAIGGMITLSGFAASAAPTHAAAGVYTAQHDHGVVKADWYWNHRRWHHRRWEHHRWHYWD